MSSRPRSRQDSASTGTPYSSSISCCTFWACSFWGSMQLSSTTKGLWISCSSRITRSSASRYSSRGISLMLPSVVTTRPMVECSLITFRVPISAAILKGISDGNQGVITMRGASFST